MENKIFVEIIQDRLGTYSKCKGEKGKCLK